MKEIKCPYCMKNIEGYTQEQIRALLDQHILAKHPEEVNFNYENK